MCINDLSLIFNHLKTVLFSDDATLYPTVKNPLNMIYTSNPDLTIFRKWCLSNRLTINLNKLFTSFLLINHKISSHPESVYHDNIIKRTSTHTLLGLTIDNKMAFKAHITYRMLKLSRITSLNYRVKKFVPRNVLKLLYDAHVLPQLQYCTAIWSSTYPTQLLPLFRMQNCLMWIA